MDVMGNFSSSVNSNAKMVSESEFTSDYSFDYNYTMPPYPSRDNFNIIFSVFAGFICFVGIVGNSLVIVVTRNRLKGLHKTMSVFILNLGVADFLFLVFCVPISVVIFTSESWHLGLFICKLYEFLVHASMLASIFTLVAMSLDRFSAVVYPLKLIQHRSISNAKIIVISIWIVSSACAAPHLVYNEVKDYGEGMQLCQTVWPTLEARKTYLTFVFLVGYLLPLFFVTCAYVMILHALWKTLRIMKGSRESNMGKSKRKVTIMVSVVVLVFGLCWFPHHLIFMWQSYGDFPYNERTIKLKAASLCLSYINSCLNPIIYSIMSENFRKAMKKALQKCGADSPNPQGSGHGRGAPIIRLTPVTQHNHHFQANHHQESNRRYYPHRNHHRHRLSDSNRLQNTSTKPITW
nr:galanin receptor 2a-like [Lytechinus pictus]